jgi:serine/threonine protein kinase
MNKYGKYETLEQIGAGGFATVYKGFDPHIKRFVAIKTCTNEDEEMRRRFRQEAEIAGNLQHRNIVTVYDFGEQEGVPFLVQEYLTGEDLDRKIKRRDLLSYGERLLYLIQIARGLEFAHQKGVIHRDIKPANIRILEDGTARIMDFGIAKLAAAQTGLTQTGMTLGTAAYLAPEQIRGESADRRTDIFSFGVLAYELLTYERPFTGEVISNVLYRILNQQPKAITTLWAQCPPQLVRLVNRCIEKEPGKRYESCTALLADLDPILRILRAQPQVGGGTTSRELSAGVMPTAALKSGPTLQRERPERPEASSEAQEALGVGDIALAYRSESERRTPRSISTSAVYRREQSRVWVWLAAAAATAVLGAGVWRYFDRSTRLDPDRPVSLTAAANPGSTTTSATAPPASAPAPATAAPVLEPTPAAAVPATPPPVATLPPPPPKTTVTIAKAWSAEMTVAIDGGAARRLDTANTIELEPGNHVLSFSLVLPDYTDSDEVVVNLKPGQGRRVETPLRRPGRVTIQQAPGTPVGLIRINSESAGMSPVRKKLLRAGVHRLEIMPVRADSGRALNLEVSVQGDQDVVVTFNLLKPEEPVSVVARPLGSS